MTQTVIFVTPAGDSNPPTGVYLGELTDELEGDYIIEFVSACPKIVTKPSEIRLSAKFGDLHSTMQIHD